MEKIKIEIKISNNNFHNENVMIFTDNNIKSYNYDGNYSPFSNDFMNNLPISFTNINPFLSIIS